MEIRFFPSPRERHTGGNVNTVGILAAEVVAAKAIVNAGEDEVRVTSPLHRFSLHRFWDVDTEFI